MTRRSKIKRCEMSAEEKIYADMSVLEQQIADRVGQRQERNGKWYDTGLRAYVLKCDNCHHLFLAGRYDKKTCSEKCKKAMLRKQKGKAVKDIDQAQMSFAQLERLLQRHAAAHVLD